MSNGYVQKAEVEAILSGGQPAVNKFVVESVISLKEGQEKLHDQLGEFGRQGTGRERRLAKTEKWIDDWERSCPDRIKQAICAADAEREAKHETIHAAHMAGFHEPDPKRKGDAKGEDHTSDRRDETNAVIATLDKRMWVLWGIFVFGALEAGHALVMYLIERAAGS